jgi:hypothetical protein
MSKGKAQRRDADSEAGRATVVRILFAFVLCSVFGAAIAHGDNRYWRDWDLNINLFNEAHEIIWDMDGHHKVDPDSGEDYTYFYHDPCPVLVPGKQYHLFSHLLGSVDSRGVGAGATVCLWFPAGGFEISSLSQQWVLPNYYASEAGAVCVPGAGTYSHDFGFGDRLAQDAGSNSEQGTASAAGVVKFSTQRAFAGISFGANSIHNSVYSGAMALAHLEFDFTVPYAAAVGGATSGASDLTPFDLLRLGWFFDTNILISALSRRTDRNFPQTGLARSTPSTVCRSRNP